MPYRPSLDPSVTRSVAPVTRSYRSVSGHESVGTLSIEQLTKVAAMLVLASSTSTI